MTWAAAPQAPAVKVRLGVENASLLGAPALMLNVRLVALVRPGDVAPRRYPVPTLSMDRLEKVAMPLTAATTTVPDSVPPPGLVVMANVMVLVAPGTVTPPRS